MMMRKSDAIIMAVAAAFNGMAANLSAALRAEVCEVLRADGVALDVQARTVSHGGRRVDLVNPKYLNRRLKDRVLAEAEVQYAEG